MNRRQQVGLKLKVKRKELGLTRVALGLRLKVSDRAIQYWEEGELMPSFTRRPAVLKALKIKTSVKKFFEGV